MSSVESDLIAFREETIELARQFMFLTNKDICLPHFESEQLYEKALEEAARRVEEAILRECEEEKK